MIHAARTTLAANPSAEDAPGLVYRLAALHRRDRDDETGERAGTWGLVRSLRARLNNGNGLPPGLRATAEAAVEVEAVAALSRGEQDEAEALVAETAPLVENEAVRRVLSLVEAHLEAGAGRYAEAAQLVEAVAVEEEAAGSGAAPELWALATLFAERGGVEGGAARPGQAEAPVASSRAGEAEAGIAAWPNPFTRSATVAVTLPEPAEARVVVYDVLGRAVAVLHEGPLEAGAHRFRLSGAHLPAGMYLVRAEADGAAGAQRWSERITLLR